MFTNVDESIAAIASAAGLGREESFEYLAAIVSREFKGCLERNFNSIPNARSGHTPNLRSFPFSRSRCQSSSLADEPKFYSAARRRNSYARLRASSRCNPESTETTWCSRRATWRIHFEAFLAGRIDLTQAEAILGVIDAETTSELLAALKSTRRRLGCKVQFIANEILDVLAHLEAASTLSKKISSLSLKKNSLTLSKRDASLFWSRSNECQPRYFGTCTQSSFGRFSKRRQK